MRLIWKRKWLFSLVYLFCVPAFSHLYAFPQIDPQIIAEFANGIVGSDYRDQVVAIHLDDAQHLDDIQNSRYKGLKEFDRSEGYGWFGYSYLGKTDSDMHVVRAKNCTGGRIVYESIILFTLEKDCGIQVNWNQGRIEKGNERFLIRKIREIGVGDRYRGDITLDGNHLVIGEDYRDRLYSRETHHHLDTAPKPPQAVKGIFSAFQQAPFVNSSIIEDLCSKEGDFIVAIDLAGSESNRYYRGKTIIDESGFVSHGTFGYRYIGTTDSGISFLMVKQNHQIGLLLVTVEQDDGVYESDEGEFEVRRTLLKKLGEIDLGKNWEGDVRIVGNKLNLQPKEEKAYSLDVAVVARS